MTAFILISTLMLAVALVWLLVPLLRHARAPALAQDASNLAILRDQLAELDADLANGTITRDHYDQARRELEQRVLEDTRSDRPTTSGSAPFAGALTAAIVGAAFPIGAMLLYFTLGSHEAFAPAVRAAADAPEHAMSPQKAAEMAAKLAARLEQDPANAEGWTTLAHTYYSLKRFPEAVAAYERAATLTPDNADLLADYADALGATTNSLEGKPLELVNRALMINPSQWKALALAGTSAFNRKDFKQAVAYWEKVKLAVPPDSDMARSIDSSIAEAKALGGIKTVAGPAAVA
ncbi:MAG: c-type cytochrome biogenesis protein CcmI, partial [Gemmatimonadaceae bacterium]|nr:c-type cytochrome biogenesis protein CcmI [Gemmatimonadaceae bacterium]